MTDPSPWRHGATPDGYPQQTSVAVRSGEQPWWSDALRDPWRDPYAPAAVVTTVVPQAPALEPVPVTQPGTATGGTRLRTVVLISVISAVLAGSLGGTLGFVFAARGGYGSHVALGAGNSSPGPLAQRPPDTFAALAKKVLPTVVTLRARVGSATSTGSGFIVSADGYAITNSHVVTGSTGNIQVSFSDASTASATVVGNDIESDLAVVKIDKSGLPPVEFGDSDSVQVGDQVMAVGSPLGLTNTVTFGFVSALDRAIRTDDEGGGKARYYSAIQTDAAVNQGNSGGPLFDVSGRVIGINSVIGTPSQDQEHAGNVGIAFSIPINQARRVAQEIIETGKARRTVIGANLDTGYKGEGAKLSSVEQGGPAAAAGLRSGDIVVKVGAGVVEESWGLIALVRRYPPGAAVGIEFIRDGGHRTVQVTLTADAK